MSTKRAEDLVAGDWIHWPLTGTFVRVVQRPKPETEHRHGDGLLQLVTQSDSGMAVIASVASSHEYEVRDEE